jgi:hypothetical protein|tara:strand:- start:254 stop:511 length:258 start_codon:yes stop_codon:yes gene_type:complete
MLNKTAQSNLKYIAIVIGILMLLPFFNRITTAVEEYRGTTNRSRAVRARRKRRGAPMEESDRSKARRKAKKCKYASRRMRKKLGC